MSEKAKYNAIADDYHQMVEQDFNSLSVLGLAVNNLLAQLGDVQGQSICDVACGDGKLAYYLTAKGATVTGVDISSELLKLARENYPDITFIEDDAQSLSKVEDAAYDVVTINFALMDIPDLQATFAAVRRILRDDGRFIFTITHPCFQSPHAENMQDDETFTGRWVKRYATEGHWKSTYSKGIRGRVGAYHRTTATYINTLIANNLAITHMVEAVIPPDDYGIAYLQSIAEIPPVMLIEAQTT